ncbi:MAG: DUF3883 domain-containing protein [Ignavibacteriales bacterium]|nr:DUF3883 domain-containing protein [Ignavibacteriales bacterium]
MNHQIFLSTPIKLNLKIINSDLYFNLKKVLGSENAEVIEDKLKLFEIKVYRFGEIFRRIVSDFNSITNQTNNKIESIQDLISILYDLYILNKDIGGIDINIPSNISIPILNKNGEETKVSNVYLGKEYENNLCEILFEYNKSKLVGSPNILGLERKEFLNEFLTWLGVASYPRKKLFSAENEYGEFVIKNFPFKEKRIYSNDATLNSYKQLNEKGFWIKEIIVETIDDLSNILINNTNENLLYWLYCDSRIIEQRETNSNSKITIDISDKRYLTIINNNDMPSYLLWKIRQIDWIKTETDRTVKTIDCCISKTITKEFSPFIEIPKVKYDNQLFKDSKIKNDEIEYFLLKIGVNKEISDFSTDTVYEMLLNLHNIDKDGKKAKIIYRELAENLDEKKIDKNSKNYQLFINNGLVYSKKNVQYSYENTKNVYYVEDKTFGEDIINQFYTADIDRRKGARKINTLFGVQPLENLEFNLKASPTVHNLNEIFQKEVEELKPYFYAFRLAKDTEGKELNWIKNSKITLCTKIEPEYKHSEELRDFVLKPYEFIYIEKRNEVYLLVEDGRKYISFADFQSNYKFADSIAEIFSSILKVDTHRSSFRELFKESRIYRGYILETELDDKNLDKLKISKKKLNVVDDPKIQFWFSILATLKKDYEYRKYKDEEFVSYVRSQINININDFKINFENVNDISNYLAIIKLFTELKIEISEFNKNSTTTLNIVPYYEYSIQQLKNDFQNHFDTLLYLYLQNKSIEEKEKFLDLQSKFETCSKFNLENSVKINIEFLFIETIKDEFQVDLSSELEVINLPEVFQKNKNELIEQLKPLNKTILNQIIENKGNLRSLTYFGEYEKIVKEYNTLLEKTEGKKEIYFNNRILETKKDDFEEFYKLITNEDPITIIEKINIKKPEFSDNKDDKNKSKGSSKINLSTYDKVTLGFIGEIIAFESLKNEFGKDNVIWDSSFAKQANINPKGDDNKHYDIKYKNKTGKWNFVEVKTNTSDKLEFKISNLEVNFGIENNSNYEIFIVTNALEEKKNRKIYKLPNPFKFGKNESFTNNSKFLVINENFSIKLVEE